MATAAIKDFLLEHDMDVYLVIFDRTAFALSKELLGAVESYIDEHYVVTHADRRLDLLFSKLDSVYPDIVITGLL